MGVYARTKNGSIGSDGEWITVNPSNITEFTTNLALNNISFIPDEKINITMFVINTNGSHIPNATVLYEVTDQNNSIIYSGTLNESNEKYVTSFSQTLANGVYTVTALATKDGSRSTSSAVFVVDTAKANETDTLNGTLSQGEWTNSTINATNESVFLTLDWPGSDMDMHLYDEYGRHVGIDYTSLENELQIPGASYSGADKKPEWIRIENVENLTLEIRIFGYQLPTPENYTVEITRWKGSKNDENETVYDPCDLNRDGIILHDYNDLIIIYKCFLGIGTNCNMQYYQNWTNMKKEYNCFLGGGNNNLN